MFNHSQLKKAGRTGLVLLAAGLVGILSSCSTISGLISMTGSITNPLDAINAKVEARVNAEISAGIGLTAMTRATIFQVLWAQVYFVGGYTFGGGASLWDGQGMVWRYTSTDEEGSESITVERARLKTLADGSQWWYLGWKSGEDVFAFEVLLDKDGLAKKLRYMDEGTGRVGEALFEGKDAMTYPQEPAASDYEGSDWKSLVKGRESVRVPGGTYQADKIQWDYLMEEGNTVSYIWWVNQDVPGALVKFLWRDGKDSMAGELMEIRSNFVTTLSSY